jgi:hypothetical protein
MLKKYLVIALFGTLAGQANATITYDDGALYTVNSAIFDDIYLDNYSDLSVVQGGLIQADSNTPAVQTSGDVGYSINLDGNAAVIGSVNFGPPGDVGEDNRVIANDHSMILGQGELTMGSRARGRSGVSGALGLVEINDSALIVGGQHDAQGGAAIENGDTNSFRTSVNGGHVVGGDGGLLGGDGVYAGLETLIINQTDGVIQGGSGGDRGGRGINSYNTVVGFINGGAITGGDGGVTGGHGIFSGMGDGYFSDFEITGGHISGGNGGDYGGDAIRHDSIYGSNLVISGGAFDAGAGLIDDGYLIHLTGALPRSTITGGQFGYENTGGGFYIERSTMDVHGWDLALVDNLLTGYLMDGNWIEVPVELDGDNYQPGVVNLINHENVRVPEPGTLLLLTLGLAATGVVKRRKQY